MHDLFHIILYKTNTIECSIHGKPKEKAAVFVKEILFFSKDTKGVSDGGDLLSHTVAHAVPSARAGLTAVFGMGTGVAPLL